jgi:CHAT domain-containing protein
MIAWTLAVLLLASEGTAEPADVVHDFIRAYADGDVERAAALWVDGGFDPVTARAMRVRCVRPLRVSVQTERLAGDVAIVESEADFVVSTRYRPSVDVYETQITRFELRRTGDGWRIVDATRREEDLARDLIAGKDVLRSSDPRAWTLDLIKLLVRETRARVTRSQFAAARDLLAVAQTIPVEGESVAAQSILASAESSIVVRDSPPDPTKALELARHALALAETAQDADAIAAALIRLTRATPPAFDRQPVYERVIELEPYVTDVLPVVQAHADRAGANLVAMRNRDAMQHIVRAAHLADESGGDPVAALTVAVMRGHIYSSQSDHELAAQKYAAALALATELGVHSSAAAMHQALGTEHRLLGNDEKLLAHVRDGLEIARVHAPEMIGPLLSERGLFFMNCGDFANAESDLIDATSAAIRHPFRNNVALAALVDLRLEQRRYDEALELAEEISAASRPADYAINRRREAFALRRLGRRAAARPILEEAIRAYETGTVAGGARQQQHFLEGAAVLYRELSSVLAEEGDARNALAVAERGKAAVLRKLIGEEGRKAMRAEDGEEEQVDLRIAALNRSLLGEKHPAKAAELRAQLRDARLRLEELRTLRLRETSYAPTASSVAIEPLPGVTVVEFVVHGDELLTFVLKPGADVVVRRAEIGEAALRGRVAKFVRMVEQRTMRYGAAARDLYDLLLAPIEAELADAERICIIPDDVLWRVPFHVLQDARGRHLIERVEVFHAPSLAVLQLASQRRRDGQPARQLVAFGNPLIEGQTRSELREIYRDATLGALPDAEAEVEAIARIHGRPNSRVYVGADARESVFKSEAARGRILHVATHGLVDDAAPMFSALLLTASKDEDGFLEARELGALELEAEVVVLAACDTARGRITRGEGVIGLSWAFLAAGVQTTVVSQWKAESKATAALMVELHRRLAVHDSPTRALRHAQLKLLENPRYRLPFYWAPFVVVGAP